MDREKEITIYDLARELNVSIATVSRALKNDPVVNKKTKKKIIELAEKKGYRTNYFAKGLRTQKTNTLGVIIPRLNSYFMSTVIAGMESIANKAGYNLIISQSTEVWGKEIESANTMFMNRVDGLLVSLANDSENLKHFDPFLSKKTPVIFFDRTEEQSIFTNIVLDNEQAAIDATQHLIEQGCKTIVHLSVNAPRSVYKARLSGYKKALRQNKIEFDDKLVIKGNLSIEFGQEAGQIIYSMKKRPDGVFAANDSSAVGCMMYLKQKGIAVPQDIAIVGFNNDLISKVIEPNLTTINYPGYEMGELAASQMISHLNGSFSLQKTKTILLHHELIIRKSSLRQKMKS
ncbi:MAG: LacI family DNA-binding transcriptional regulator [Saprospiraceae bacterium]